LIRCGSNSKKPITFNSKNIGREEFVIMPHLLIRRTNGQKPLLDYLQKHVVISKEYLKVM
jgi:hypothetical protein